MIKYFKIIEKKNLWFTFSSILIISGFIMMGIRILNHKPALNYGIDFVGGQTLMFQAEELNQKQAGNSNPNQIKQTNIEFTEKLRNTLKPLGLENASIQISKSNDIIIKITESETVSAQKIIDAVTHSLGKINVLEIDLIGPTVGAELRGKSLLITLVASLALLGYISFRFKFEYGLAAILATLHDGLITISFASLAGIEIDSTFVAAILTILGYSINDTIVIFDRIRETIAKNKDTNIPLSTILNNAINQTFGRTLNTVGTTLIVILSLIFFGGSTIQGFCITLFVGILAGAYSSIFVASPILFLLYKRKNTILEKNTSQ